MTERSIVPVLKTGGLFETRRFESFFLRHNLFHKIHSCEVMVEEQRCRARSSSCLPGVSLVVIHDEENKQGFVPRMFLRNVLGFFVLLKVLLGSRQGQHVRRQGAANTLDE